MRKIIFLMLLFITSSYLNAQTQKIDEQKKLNEIMTKFFDGIAELDFTKMKQYATKDVIVLESGAVWSMDSLTKFLAPLKSMNFKRTNELRFIQTEVKGNTAWVIYNNTANIDY
jgi:ketosteroid isomerase-like protein